MNYQEIIEADISPISKARNICEKAALACLKPIEFDSNGNIVEELHNSLIADASNIFHHAAKYLEAEESIEYANSRIGKLIARMKLLKEFNPTLGLAELKELAENQLKL